MTCLQPSLIILIALTGSLSTRIAVIVADLLVLAVTWYKTAGTVRQAHRLGIRAPLWEIMLRDGELSVLNEQLKLRTNGIIWRIVPTERKGTLFFL